MNVTTTFAGTVPIVVTHHARQQATTRFEGFDPDTIEQEVRTALQEGRVTTDRRTMGLAPGSDPTCLYVASEDGSRVYAIRVDFHDHNRIAVITAMKGRERA